MSLVENVGNVSCASTNQADDVFFSSKNDLGPS
jgi:hypothetical protein